MPYWRECPGCGVCLDPGEICDCQKQATKQGRSKDEARKTYEKELSGATNTEQLKAEQKSDEPLSSASSLSNRTEESKDG